MTAANIWVGQSAAYLLTDTAGTANDGTVIGFPHKIISSDRLRMAISKSGYSSAAIDDTIEEWMTGCTDQEAAMHAVPVLVDRLAALLTHDRARYANWGPPDDEAAFIQLFIAIWSIERQQPEAYIIGSHQGYFPPQVVPRRLFPVGFYCAPDVDAALRPKVDG